MSTLVSQKEKLIKVEVENQPSLLLTMPFEPKLYSRQMLQQQVRQLQNKAETMLLAEYTLMEVKSLLERLRVILKELNYDSFKKSIVLYVTSSEKKLLYLNVNLETNILVNTTFNISDLLYLIQQPVKYLVCVLNDHWAKTYLGDDSTIRLMKRDAPDPGPPHSSDFHLGSAKRNCSGSNSFYKNIATDFRLLLNAYPLPVFLIGSESQVNCFLQFAENTKDIVQVIYKTTANLSEPQILNSLRSYVRNWHQTRLQYLNSQLQDAFLNDMVIPVSNTVLNQLNHADGKLLIENGYLSEGRNLNKSLINVHGDLVLDNYEEQLAQVVEHLLQSGSSVEIVPDGFLKNGNSVVFICNPFRKLVNYRVKRPENSYEFF